MSAAEGLDLSSLIEDRIQRDYLTLEEIQEQIADLILVREIFESLQVARKQGVGRQPTRIKPTNWAEFVKLPLSTEEMRGRNRNLDESRCKLTQALGRVGTVFDIPDAHVRVGHSHIADTLAIDAKLF